MDEWMDIMREALNMSNYNEMLRLYPSVYLVVAALVGACVGSFLNVCIYRIPRGIFLFYPPSRCPNCGHSIRFYENIPILSWLCLCGRCSGCEERIRARYIFVETLTAGLYALIFYQYVLLPKLMLSAPVIASLLFGFVAVGIALCAAYVDCDLHIIPRRFTILLILLALSYRAFGDFSTIQYKSAGICAVVMLIAGGFLSLLAVLGKKVFKRDALGWGDVWYLTGIAGCFGLVNFLFLLLASCLLTILLSPLYLLLKRGRNFRKWRHAAIPFGPFISLAFLCWIIWFEPIQAVAVRFFPRAAEGGPFLDWFGLFF